jgi:hypothetical protein
MTPSNFLRVARRIRRSVGFRSFLAAPKRLAIRLQQKRNRDIFSVEIEGNSGFFAIMQMILFILVHCEKNDLYPDLSAKGGIYGEKTASVDWLKELFTWVHTPKPAIAARLAARADVRTSKIKGIDDLGLRARYEKSLTIAGASRLFAGYLRPSASVTDEVNRHCDSLGISAHTLAVHYRGTDKIGEAAKVSWEDLCEAAAQVAANSPALKNILLATDQSEFIDFFKNYAFPIPVIVAPATHLAQGQIPVHFSGYEGLAIGREALVTSLLLSRCGFLLKSPSYLSGWAKIFNPELPTWLIAPPKAHAMWFPDRVLWLNQGPTPITGRNILE